MELIDACGNQSHAQTCPDHSQLCIKTSAGNYVLILNSYYMQYQNQAQGAVDLTNFFKMIDETETFKEYPREYVEHVYRKFTELLPVLNQMKVYQ